MSTVGAGTSLEVPELEPLSQRIMANLRSGNLGSGPVAVALAIVVLIFALTAQNFWSPANFQNIITTMAGPCLIAYGVIFVLLIGEIDLSVAFVSGVAGVVVAQLQRPDGANLPWWVCVLAAIAAAAAIGAFQGSIIALVRRLAEQGLGVVLISHNLHDIFETATRITVLRLGRNAGLFERAAVTQDEVVHAITAGQPTKVSGIAGAAHGATL